VHHSIEPEGCVVTSMKQVVISQKQFEIENGKSCYLSLSHNNIISDFECHFSCLKSF